MEGFADGSFILRTAAASCPAWISARRGGVGYGGRRRIAGCVGRREEGASGGRKTGRRRTPGGASHLEKGRKSAVEGRTVLTWTPDWLAADDGRVGTRGARAIFAICPSRPV